MHDPSVNKLELADKVTVEGFRELADPVIEQSFKTLLDQINADAAAVWLKDGAAGSEVLTIAYNIGGRGSELENQVSQSLDSGLVSKAFRESSTICHEGLFCHQEQSHEVDRQLHQLTAHQIAAPFSIAGNQVGAVTAVQIQDERSGNRTEWGFEHADVSAFENWVAIMERLFELNLRRQAN